MAVREIIEYSNEICIVDDSDEGHYFNLTNKTVHDHGMRADFRSELRDAGYELVSDKVDGREYPSEIELSYYQDASAFKEMVADELGIETTDWHGEVFEKLSQILSVDIGVEIDDDGSVHVSELNGVNLEEKIELDLE